MSKILQIKLFNDILDQLLEYIENNFPYYKSDIIVTSSYIEFVRKSNPRLVCEKFMKIIGPYTKEINECNESFFLDFEKNLTKSKLTTDNILSGLKIKKLWQSSTITDIQKAYLWMYFQKLTKSGELIVDTR